MNRRSQGTVQRKEDTLQDDDSRKVKFYKERVAGLASRYNETLMKLDEVSRQYNFTLGFYDWDYDKYKEKYLNNNQVSGILNCNDYKKMIKFCINLGQKIQSMEDDINNIYSSIEAYYKEEEEKAIKIEKERQEKEKAQAVEDKKFLDVFDGSLVVSVLGFLCTFILFVAYTAVKGIDLCPAWTYVTCVIFFVASLVLIKINEENDNFIEKRNRIERYL